MSAWFYLLPAFLLGLGIGGYIEYHRWLRWMRREHLDELNTPQ